MRNLRNLLSVAMLAALLVTVACDSSAPATQTPVPAPTVTIAGALTPSSGGATITPAAGLPRITYDVSGGFIGVHDTLEIAPSGQAKLSSKAKVVSTRQLDAQRVQKLSQLLAAADFANLKPKYDSGNVADDIYESVSVTPANGDGPTKVVVAAAEGGKGLTPPALLNLLSGLRDAVAYMRPAGTPGNPPASPVRRSPAPANP
jgi:hypothetical protein